MPDEPNAPDRKTAVALEYDTAKNAAPVVTASGRGLVAERIIEIARQHGIPIKEDRDLVQLLAQLDLGDVIPPSLYLAVAEILAFVYSVNKERQRPGG